MGWMFIMERKPSRYLLQSSKQAKMSRLSQKLYAEIADEDSNAQPNEGDEVKEDDPSKIFHFFTDAGGRDLHDGNAGKI